MVAEFSDDDDDTPRHKHDGLRRLRTSMHVLGGDSDEDVHFSFEKKGDKLSQVRAICIGG